jgi:hypothetical protein
MSPFLDLTFVQPGAPQTPMGMMHGGPGQQFVFTPQAMHVAAQGQGTSPSLSLSVLLSHRLTSTGAFRAQDPFGRSGTPLGDMSAAAAAGLGGGGGPVSASDPGAERYGMMGLLGVVRMSNSDLNLLALGTDLTVLGLNLSSTECASLSVSLSLSLPVSLWF